MRSPRVRGHGRHGLAGHLAVPLTLRIQRGLRPALDAGGTRARGQRGDVDQGGAEEGGGCGGIGRRRLWPLPTGRQVRGAGKEGRADVSDDDDAENWCSCSMLGKRAGAIRSVQSGASSAAVGDVVICMDILEIGESIAERTLVMGAEEVVVTIGKPRPFDDGEDYFCPYSIEYAGQKKVSYAGGMDAVQALQLTMKKIGADLSHLAKTQGVLIAWLPDSPGDTGFSD